MYLLFFYCRWTVVHLGYPHLSSALVMCSTSFYMFSSSDTMLLHLSNNALMTPSFPVEADGEN